MSKGFIYAFFAAVAWAITITVTRFVLAAGENAYNIAFWTTILAIPYWLFIFLGRKNELKKVARKDYLILLGIGLVSTVGVSIAEAFALKYSPALNFSFLIRTTILFTILFAYVFLGERLTFKKIILTVLILSGAYLLTTRGLLTSLSLGDTFTIIEAALIALGNSVFGKMATNRMSVKLSSSGGFIIGVMPMALIAFANNAIAVPKSLLLIILLTLVSIISMNLRFRAYRNATASYVAMIYSFTPVIVSLIAVPFLRETILPIQIVGGGLIILAGITAGKLKI